ncbi:CidA/LrgA family protein [Pseudoalteromonas sp. T1lg65]|uniref:CidA/LrgA family protein n=1 Tax=Pseudoalteromonas sp. T1lg65 TaxID=2077101 RepID=UPI003F7A377A
MPHSIKLLGRFAFAFLLIVSCLATAKLAVKVFSLTFPAAILGMLLLLTLLTTGVVKPHWLAPAAEPILKYMALFFIPAGVGLVEHVELFSNHLGLFVLLLLGVPIIGLVILSKLVVRVKFRD